MWIVRLALRRPYTFIVFAIVVVLMTPFVLMRMPTDILPEIDIPVISINWSYSGFSPDQMENYIVSQFERFLTTVVSDIDHIESQTIAGRSVIKVFFHPGADVRMAIAESSAAANAQLHGLPPGTGAPLIITYSASAVPILQLGMRGDGLSEQELFDFSVNVVRNQMATVPGASVTFPYGGKQRQVSVNVDIPALQAKGLSPVDVINTTSSQNLALPAGTVKIGPTEYNVQMNGSTDTIAALNDLPIRTANGATIYVRDVARVSDSFSPQINIVRMDGQRGVLVSIYKSGSGSTLDVAKRVYEKLPQVASILPTNLIMSPLFDQSIFVRAAVQGVIREGLIAACLTALMILLFLGSWRSTVIIALSIPLSVLISIIVLGALHETINIMTLGGLALAVGVLVDDATVAIENIERNLAEGKDTVTAILDGSEQIAIPALVSTLCICIVFVPMFFLTGVAKFLFVPLAEAVVFAMLASYLLSRTLVPTLAMYLLNNYHQEANESGGIFTRAQRSFAEGFDRMRERYRAGLSLCLEHAWAFVLVFLALCLGSGPIVLLLGSDFFPGVDAGLIRLHMRGRAGQRVEETARECDSVDGLIRQVIPPHDLANILDNIGLFNSTINFSYSNSGVIGESDAEFMIGLKPDRSMSTRHYVDELRGKLKEQFPGTQFFFQPADIVTQILNFGVPAPIDIQFIGPNIQANYRLAQEITNQVQRIPGAVDVHVHQLFSYPTLFLDVDRTRAQSVGLSEQQVANSLLLTLSSSSQIEPSFWVNPANGFEYNVAVQVPQYQINSMQNLQNIPISSASADRPQQLLSNLAQLHLNGEPEVITHYNNQPMIDIYASTEGRDLGGVASDIRKVMARYQGKLPRGTQMILSGQVATMTTSFAGLGAGVALAIVLVYFLIVVNFQSWLDPFIIITALPGALAGILWILLLTHTTLSVPSLTGTIMCMGVATANSILLISFARQRMNEGLTSAEAALDAGYVRIRPVLMTAMAMIIGMVPMSLGLGEGGEQNAPLGRAVIGGLMVATVATLFFVPCVFSLVHRKAHGEVAVVAEHATGHS